MSFYCQLEHRARTKYTIFIYMHVVLLGSPLRGSLKVSHKPLGEGGVPWQVPKPNSGVMIFSECFGIVVGFDIMRNYCLS